MQLINDRSEYAQFTDEHLTSTDWQHAAESYLDARVEGRAFTAHGHWPRAVQRTLKQPLEQHVIFSRIIRDEFTGAVMVATDIAAVNLATLCAWAAEPPQNQTAQSDGIDCHRRTPE
ncbi:hypothetical protein GCM10029976_066990 [Kribbella albertanoniae]|uniref:Uncharacterized protein n=1 Tax=Kribbella albertanoniae TaxID=1266829 RepID=A0A4R4QJ24_9ACTN|nr:hypothetical protein [Kribbella albertanoniae]TDC35811.1 hypothetical protein E1261_00345 [Kribbella albertanoniae]